MSGELGPSNKREPLASGWREPVAVSFRSAFLKPSCSLSCSLPRPNVSFFVLFYRAQQVAGSRVRGCDILVACGRDPSQRTGLAGATAVVVFRNCLLDELERPQQATSEASCCP